MVVGSTSHRPAAIVRRARRIGLSNVFKHDAIAGRCVRAACALPLLPPHAIPGALPDIMTLASTAQDLAIPMLQTLCQYIKRHWVEKRQSGLQECQWQAVQKEPTTAWRAFMVLLENASRLRITIYSHFCRISGTQIRTRCAKSKGW